LRIPCGLPQGDLVKYIKISGAAKQHHLGVIPCGLATGIVKVKEIFYLQKKMGKMHGYIEKKYYLTVIVRMN